MMFAQSLRSAALFSLLLAGVAFLPSSLRGQATDRGDSALRAPTVVMLTPATATESALAGGPRIAPVAVVRQATPLDLGQPQRNIEEVNAGHDVGMMGVGAAGIAVGLIIGGKGGSIIALSGGVIGLVGLFRYLR